MSKKKNNKTIPVHSGNQLIYSTNNSVQHQINRSASPKDQNLRVRLEKNGRGGKNVSLIYNFEGNDKDLSDLAKKLKAQCGTGGSAKDGEIIIQGDHIEKILKLLIDWGYTKTKKGGG